MRKIGFVLLGVFALLVIFLRVWKLGIIPTGLNVDEASYGYDAYSLSVTGRDMWSQRGTTFKSFGDYKPAGLGYILIPLVKAVGLTTTTTRIPSALFGILTLITTFAIARLLTKNPPLSFLTTLMLALTPWHFGISRQFYEANVGLFFMAVTIYCQLCYLDRKDTRYLYASVISTALAGYFYAIYRYLGMGLFGITLLIANDWRPRQNGRTYAKALLIAVVVALPYLKDMFSVTGLIRMQQEGAMHTFGDELTINENRQMCYLASGKNHLVARACYALWNKPGQKLIATTKSYVQFLSPKYLFLDGYQKDITPPTYGAFLEVTLVLYLLGLWYIIQSYSKTTAARYILWGLLLSPIPAASALGLVIHRNLLGLFFVFLTLVYGATQLVAIIRRYLAPKMQLLSAVAIGGILVWSQARYIANYFFVYAWQQPEIWHYDAPTLMPWLHTHAGDKPIYFYDYEFAPLYYAFYGPLYPSIYQYEAKWTPPNTYGWTHTYGIGTRVMSGDNVWKQICAPEPSYLVLTPRKEWSAAAELTVRDFTEVSDLYAVYDSRAVYKLLDSTNPATLTAQCKELVKQ